MAPWEPFWEPDDTVTSERRRRPGVGAQSPPRSRTASMDPIRTCGRNLQIRRLDPTNAASLYAAGPGRLTVGFELIMAGEPQPGRDSSRDSTPSEIIPLRYSLCDGGLHGHPPRCTVSLG